jgi:hypothetical protein
MLFDRLPERLAHVYLVLAFFVIPAAGVILTGGTRPAGPVATVILWGVVVHHGTFLIASVVD